MNRTYQVAGHRFMLWGDKLCKAVEGIAGFRPFESQDGEVLFAFMEDTAVPVMENVEYTFGYEDVRGFFGRTVKGFMLKLEPSGGNALYLWCTDGGNEVWICGNLSARLYRFALWVGYGLMTLPYGTIAVHSSCIVYRDRAVLFLGESGTGKSTHTRLWREHVEGAFLLNDDSPVLRVEDDVVRVYGSPWSGKTPCYRQECYKLEACVRLSQAPYNRITRLSVLQAYGAVHPSGPPEFAYDNGLYDHVSRCVDKLLQAVPFYHLACLPDREAARLACRTIFKDTI